MSIFSDYAKHKDAKFSEGLFWEFDVDKFDWEQSAGTVVQRVIERGDINDYYAAINLYGGMKNFRAIIRDKVPYLSPRDLNFASKTFKIKKEKMLCYTLRQLASEHLNF